MPLLRAQHKAGAIPEDHTACTEKPCMQCAAEENLDARDFEVLSFLRTVQDQVVNIYPFGGDKEAVVPRLEGWVAALMIYGFPPERWRDVVDDARYVMNILHDRHKERGVFSMPIEDLAPLE